MTGRVLLIGLDGATFDLLDRYVERGLMPNLGRMKREGAWGALESTNPPTTPPAWSTCVTGVNPGRHGVYDFRESFHLDPGRPLISGRSIRARTLWRMLTERGRRSCIVNFPVSFPADELDGVFVTGMMTPDGRDDFTFPPEEAARLREAVPDYVVNVDIPRYDVDRLSDALLFLDDLDRCLDARIAALHHYREREPWALFFPTFVFHDRLGHLFWKIMAGEPGFVDGPYNEAVRPRIEAMYRRFDAALGRVLDTRAPDETVMICSDHGFGGTSLFFEVNAWLERLGLLRLKPGAKLRGGTFLRAMDLADRAEVKRALPERLQSAVRRKIRAGRSSFRSGLEEAVDWTRTKAFFASIPAQGLFVVRRSARHPGGVADEAEYRALRERLMDELSRLLGPDGLPVVDRVWTREELYSGPYLGWAPDLVFVARNYACLGRAILGGDKVFRDPSDTAHGFHRMDGVWLALGEGIAAGEVRGAHIADVTPTVLHALGEAVPDDLDGRVLLDCWTGEARRARPVRYCEAARYEAPEASAHGAEDARALGEQLRALGYVE